MGNISKRDLNIMKWVSGGCEAFLGIPIFGGLFIISMAWVPLFVMLAFHILILIFSVKSKHELPIGNIVGIGANVIGIIPGVGMVLHIISAVLIMVDAAKTQKQLANET